MIKLLCHGYLNREIVVYLCTNIQIPDHFFGFIDTVYELSHDHVIDTHEDDYK